MHNTEASGMDQEAEALTAGGNQVAGQLRADHAILCRIEQGQNENGLQVAQDSFQGFYISEYRIRFLHVWI
jgi:hypothetical protein